MRKYGFIAWLFYSSSIFAQTNDSFSDGDFTHNPVWSGGINQFIVNSTFQLQLKSTAAGTSYLSTPFVASLGNIEWQFFAKQSFSPSANNFSRVYIASDGADLTQPLNGYFLQFGEAGSNDAIELFRQSGSTLTSVCRARNGGIASSFALRVLVKRNQTGQWTILVDYAGGSDFVKEAEGQDDAFASASFIGIQCVYTSSNDSKFFFDDFQAGPQLTDSSPPVLDSLEILSQNTLKVAFSEVLDSISAEDPSNFSVNGIGVPQSSVLANDHMSVVLSFGQSFVNGIQYVLSLSGVKDLNENVMSPVTVSFLYFVPITVKPKDVIITEIFPDPTPAVGLPDAEYVEIHNQTTQPIDLSNWKFSDGSSTALLPRQIILPDAYWVLTSSSSLSGFDPAHTLGLTGFPTLNNDEDHLTLKTPDGKVIDSVSYSLGSYHDSDKAEGGWSVELIDLNNPCGEEENWTASEDPSGGTPGRPNSVAANKPDLTGPHLLQIIPDSLSITVLFNEKLSALIPPADSFTITPDIVVLHSAFLDGTLRKVLLNLETPLSYRQLYTLKISNTFDCSGNPIDEGFCQLDFAMTEAADSTDIVINEILFNPRPGGVDFVEIQNVSPKFISLNGWKLANMEMNVPVNAKQMDTKQILFPLSYFAFTPDPAILKSQYAQSDESRLINADLPSLPDDEGSIVLVNKSGKVLDFFLYNKNFHSDLIKNDEGVSLERISSVQPTNNPQNWRSATASCGFATPGSLNSNARPLMPTAQGKISVDPEIFVPGSSVDFAGIRYSFEKAGYVANIKILDQLGRLIKVVANNESLGFEGFFRWDGDRDDGSRARMGYYFVWTEVFDLTGSVQTFRNRVVIAFQ